MKSFKLTPAAVDDIASIEEYLEGVAGPAVSDRVRVDIKQQIRRLAAHPGLGHARADLTAKPYLFSSVHSYLIVYRRVPNGIEVVRVLHAARDVGLVFEEE